MKKVWYVTGASKGLGLELVKTLLGKGYQVAATSRSPAQLTKDLKDYNADNFLPLQVDLTSNSSVADSIRLAVEKFGSLDVVVNNAGYGIGGAVEELDDTETADCFNVNVFATVRVIKYALPYMRKQGSGHIINISSIAGFAAASGWGMYAATKYAVMGLSEVLAEDVKSLGIHVTVVAPGAFRTRFLSDESLVFAKNKIDAYSTVHDSHARYMTMDGTQKGDPEKAVELFIALVENPNPPVRLFMGSDAWTRAQAKINLLASELEQFKDLSFSTDFAEK